MTRTYTILAIDDTKKILDIVKHFLEGAGYNVKIAADPLTGIDIAKSGGIDLIILDIMMPKMSGYEVAEVLQKFPNTSQIPIIMLTAKTIISHTPKHFYYGLYGFLSKPFSKIALLKAVSEVINAVYIGKGR